MPRKTNFNKNDIIIEFEAYNILSVIVANLQNVYTNHSMNKKGYVIIKLGDKNHFL